MTQNHTPTPWSYVAYNDGYALVQETGAPYTQYSSDIGDIGAVTSDPKYIKEANAAFIVRACNSHAALVEALETVQSNLLWYREEYPEAQSGVDDETYKMIKNALAQAKGE